MEYVTYSLEDLTVVPQKLSATDKDLHRLFLCYLYGFKALLGKGYIHGDIKPPNLRFEIKDGKYIGKIIDLDIRNIGPTATGISGASDAYTPATLLKFINDNMKRIHSGTIDDSEKTALLLSNKIAASKYDMYMLAVSFNELFVSKLSPQMNAFIQKCRELTIILRDARQECTQIYVDLYGEQPFELDS
jgi:hypothetical protein